MIHRLACLLLVALAGCAHAQELRNPAPTPHDFAWQWPLSIEPGEELVRLDLSQEIYERLWRDDVSDLVVFNGAHEPVPMAPLASVTREAGIAARETLPPLEVAAFRIPPSPVRNIGDRVRLVLSQRSDGRLERLDAELDEPEEPAASAEWLLDLSNLHAPARGLLLDLEDDAAPLLARVDVFGSRDLSGWTRLAAGQALVSLNEGGLKLERRRIEFASTALPYLRLVRIDSRQPLPLQRVRILRAPSDRATRPALARVELSGHPQPRPGEFRYDASGPFPVRQIAVSLADNNAAANVIVESRARADLPWRERVRGPVFRLTGKQGEIESMAMDIAPVRDRQWRVRTEPAQARAPILVLSWLPDQFAFLTQGEGPWRLAAGSARSQRVDAPLQAVYLSLGQSREEAWQGSVARIGRVAELAGGVALAPRPDTSGSPTPWQWLLWGLLLAGAFAIVTMVLRLLRQSGA